MYQKTFMKKNCIKELWKNHFKMFLNYAEFRIKKDNLCFYKTFTNQIFPFISSKVVYFKKHLAYQV